MMNPAPIGIRSRFVHWTAYSAYLGLSGTLVQTVVQRADPPDKNIRLGISLGALGVNFAAYLWLSALTDDIPHNHWKAIVFKIVFIFTGILAPYAAYSMLAPDWLTWYVYAIICAVIALYNCYNVLKSTFKWGYNKVVDATNYVIGKLSKLIRGNQLGTSAAPPLRPSV